MYLNGSEELNLVHNYIMATINLFWMHLERYYSPQDFCDKYALWGKYAKTRGAHWTIKPTCQGNSQEAKYHKFNSWSIEGCQKRASECIMNHVLVLFWPSEIWKVIKDMENNVLRKKDPLSKNTIDACGILTGWRNNHGGRSVQIEENEGVELTTVSSEKEQTQKKGVKKKGMMGFKNCITTRKMM